MLTKYIVVIDYVIVRQRCVFIYDTSNKCIVVVKYLISATKERVASSVWIYLH